MSALGNWKLRFYVLAIFMAVVSSLVGALIVLYSFGSIRHYPHQNDY